MPKRDCLSMPRDIYSEQGNICAQKCVNPSEGVDQGDVKFCEGAWRFPAAVYAVEKIHVANGRICLVDQMGFPVDRKTALQMLLACQHHLLLTDEDLEMIENNVSQRMEQFYIDESLRLKSKKTESQSKSGFIYVLKAEKSPYSKIGFTQNPKQRLKQIQAASGSVVSFVYLKESNDVVALEAKLHDLFKEKRVTGEWFELTSEDIEQIRFYCNAASDAEVAS
ncbi:MAG: GIY-YIG nuclease family protein [Microcoleus sp.]